MTTTVSYIHTLRLNTMCNTTQLDQDGHFQRKMSCLRRHLNPQYALKSVPTELLRLLHWPSISTSWSVVLHVYVYVSYGYVYMCLLYCNRAMAEEGEKLASKIGPVSLYISIKHNMYMHTYALCNVISFQMLRDLHTYLQKVNQIFSVVFQHKFCVLPAGLTSCWFKISPDLHTSQAVPDTKLTLKKYSDAKFEFLVRYLTWYLHHCMLSHCGLCIYIDSVWPQAYCLKVKEMDDEEYEAAVSLLFTCANVSYMCSPILASGIYLGLPWTVLGYPMPPFWQLHVVLSEEQPRAPPHQ